MNSILKFLHTFSIFGEKWVVIYKWGQVSNPVTYYNAEKVQRACGGTIKHVSEL